MSKKTIITSFALVASLLIGTASAYARMGGSNNGHWNGGHNSNYGHDNAYGHNMGMGHGYQNGYKGQNMQANENLTDAQKASLEKLENEYVAKVNPIRQNLAAKSAEYAALMNGQNPSPKEAGKLAGEISKIRQDLQEIGRDYVQRVEKETGIAMNGGFHRRGYHNW